VLIEPMQLLLRIYLLLHIIVIYVQRPRDLFSIAAQFGASGGVTWRSRSGPPKAAGMVGL
jgi:hypothetical protein